MSLLRVESLRMSLASSAGMVRAVDDVSFEVAEGETFALLGESGCGKSMTALSLMRLLPDAGVVESGRVILGGRDLLSLTESQMRAVRGREMAMIFQEPATSLNPVLSIGVQIVEVLTRHAVLGGADLQRRAVELLRAVGIPDPQRRLQEFPFQLSGGMKQRVMIAMALAANPSLLIADEPTTALDVTTQAQVLDLLGDLQRRHGMGMLLITHDLGIVWQLAKRIGVMYAGELIEVAARQSFFAAPSHPYSKKLLAALPGQASRRSVLETIPGSVPSLLTRFSSCRFAERCPSVWDRCHREAPGWHATDRGQVRCHLYDPAESSRLVEAARFGAPARAASDVPCGVASPLLVVDGLKMHFPIRRGFFKRVVGHVKAVDGVSFSLASGRTLALVGESGCGKTTVGKAILQLYRASGGSIRFDEKRLEDVDASSLRAMRAQMQIVFQDPYGSLDPRMRISDSIEEGLISLRLEMHAGLRDEKVCALLERVGLSADMRWRYPHEFSGGQRQRIAIARALAVEPRLLICDEPTSALDVSVQAQILNLLQKLQNELGLAYLFITHNLAVAEHLAHQIAVMYLGRIVEFGTADEILHDPRHPYTSALIAAVPRITESSGQNAQALAGDMPSPSNPPRGCHFHSRCPDALPACAEAYPPVTDLSETRWIRCHLYKQ